MQDFAVCVSKFPVGSSAKIKSGLIALLLQPVRAAARRRLTRRFMVNSISNPKFFNISILVFRLWNKKLRQIT
jgi:hypothetical protein